MKKIIITIYTFIISVSILMGTTWAWLTTVDFIENDFAVADLNGKVEEEFSPPTDSLKPGAVHKKDIKVKNFSNQPVFVRVMVLPQIILGEVVLESDGAIGFNIDDTNWLDGQDGYFYYRKALKEGDTTTSLINEVTVSETLSNTLYNNAKFDIMVKSELSAITVDNAHVNAWWQGIVPTSEPLKTISQELENIAAVEGGR